MAPAPVRRAPYKDFLQPALHRRFSTTAAILLGIAYVQALCLGSFHSLWFWFPLGPAGIRAGFLFACSLVIIVLRIAQYHVGLRTSDSAFQNFTQNTLKWQTLEAVVSYGLSSWLFSQICLWSVDKDANLNWILYSSGDRARLNEKPLYFTTHFIIFGFAQGLFHVLNDRDRLTLGSVKATKAAAAGSADVANPFKRFLDRAPLLLLTAVTYSLVALIISLFSYLLIIRPFAWRTALSFFRPFYSLPKTNMLPASWPVNFHVLWRCLLMSILLSFSWLAADYAFSILIVKEPMKNGRPLTSDAKDPNGSLLNGLKSKKLPIKCFAMWELAIIANDFDVRRKAIYEDLDRKDGPMWSQVYAICLDTIKSIEIRIDSYGKPPAVASTSALASTSSIEAAAQRISQPPRTDDVLVPVATRKSFRGEVEKVVGQVATSPGQPSRLSPIAQKAVSDVKGKLSAIKQEATGSGNPESPFQNTMRQFLSSPLGKAFRQEFGRRLTSAVLGRPFGEPSLYINAADALTKLAIHSLTEDRYGNVQRDVSSIIRTLTTVAKKLENFKAGFPTHWTDIGDNRATPEVDAILEALKTGLKELINEFGPYSKDLRLSLTDMRLAREAAGMATAGNEVTKQQEMRQLR